MAGHRMRLLGGFELQGADNERLSTRKAEALLAYLALSAGQVHRRDKLAGLLWGNKEERRARHSLAQALHLIRAALKANGADPLIIDGTTVAMDLSVFDVDAVAFERLVVQRKQEDLSTAAALYRGDLLDGLEIGEPGFEDWLLGERQRLRSLALNALERLLKKQQQTEENAAAINTANRLIVLEPIHEAAHRSLMRLYCRIGRQEAAIRQYQTCANVLRHELGIEPQAETKSLFEEILVQRGEPVPRDVPAPREPLATNSIAVLPFANMSDDPEQAYFAAGLTEDLATELSRPTGVNLLTRTPKIPIEDLSADPVELGARLQVRYLLEGSVRKVGRNLRVTAKLIRTSDGSQIWAERYDLELKDIFNVQDDITARIAGTIDAGFFGNDSRKAINKPPQNADAYDLYLKSDYHYFKFTRPDNDTAFDLAKQAVALDSGYAGGHVMLSLCWRQLTEMHWTEDYESALAQTLRHAQKAVGVDRTFPQSYQCLAIIESRLGHADRALAAIHEALAMNPNRSVAHAQHAQVLSNAECYKQALEAIGKARMLAPHRTPGWYGLIEIWTLLGLSRFEEAEASCNRTLTAMPNTHFVHYLLGAVLALAGDQRQAKAAIRQALVLKPNLTVSSILNAQPFRLGRSNDPVIEGLRKAGLPER